MMVLSQQKKIKPSKPCDQRTAYAGSISKLAELPNSGLALQTKAARAHAPSPAPSYITQDQLSSQLQQLSNSLRQFIYQNDSAAGSLPSTGGYTNNIALSQKIDKLSGTSLSDITVSGISGITDADIPDSLTASNYLPLAGGTLSGDLVLTGNLTVSGAQTLSGAITIPYLTATSTATPSSFQQLLVNASTTLQNFTALNGTTTSFFSTTASSTNLFAQTASLGSLALARGSIGRRIPTASRQRHATASYPAHHHNRRIEPHPHPCRRHLQRPRRDRERYRRPRPNRPHLPQRHPYQQHRSRHLDHHDRHHRLRCHGRHRPHLDLDPHGDRRGSILHTCHTAGNGRTTHTPRSATTHTRAMSKRRRNRSITGISVLTSAVLPGHISEHTGRPSPSISTARMICRRSGRWSLL